MTMTTVGYGDVAAVSKHEKLFAILVMVVGAGIFGYGIYIYVYIEARLPSVVCLPSVVSTRQRQDKIQARETTRKQDTLARPRQRQR